MKNNWRTLQTVLTVFIRIFIALCKNGLVMRMKAFISRPFPAAVQLNKKKKLAGYYAGPWQLLFNAWCNNRVPNTAVLALLLQQCLSHFQCEEVIAARQ